MLIDKNIEILSDGRPHWIGEANSENCPQFLYKFKGEEFFELTDGRVISTKGEIDTTYKVNTYKKELIFIFGINGIDEINEVYRKKHKDSMLIVIEPNLYLFNHTLNSKKLSIFKKSNILLYADNNTEKLNEFLQLIVCNLEVLGYIKHLRFYMTEFYRKEEALKVKSFISVINQVVTSIIRSMGNDVLDSLQGLEQNLTNLKYIKESRNPAFIKGYYKNKPAIIVAAGPSLNKNIDYLKEVQGRAVIIAVDTILSKLISIGVIPDFVCSVERVSEVYEYFYKEQKIPKTVTLVGPPLLDSRIFQEYSGEIMLPFRTEVMEYKWLQDILEVKEESGMLVGMSCAHMAFGVAHHLGCSPIILVGQDLAYGESFEETHAGGTMYDNLKDDKRPKEQVLKTDGYFGVEVNTTSIWTMFRVWFEAKTAEYNINVINATEGGARIQNTLQMTLLDAIMAYCREEIEPVSIVIKQIEKYDINIEFARKNLSTTVDYIDSFRRKCLTYFNNISNIEVSHEVVRKNSQQINNELSKIHELNREILTHPLFSHNIQALLIKFLWNYNEVEQIWNVENFSRIRDVEIRYLGAVIVTLTEIEDRLKNALNDEIFKKSETKGD